MVRVHVVRLGLPWTYDEVNNQQHVRITSQHARDLSVLSISRPGKTRTVAGVVANGAKYSMPKAIASSVRICTV